MDFGNILRTDPLDLGPMGAPGFKMKERIDFSGHANIDPHVNVDLLRPDDSVIGYLGKKADFRDIIENQISGCNGMQQSRPVEVTLQNPYGNSW